MDLIITSVLLIIAVILSALSFHFKYGSLCIISALLWVFLGIYNISHFSTSNITDIHNLIAVFCLLMTILMLFAPIIMREKKVEDEEEKLSRVDYLQRRFIKLSGIRHQKYLPPPSDDEEE